MKNKESHLEIERRFLPGEGFNEKIYEGCMKKDIAQAYVSVSPVIRLRKANEEYVLTIKGETDTVQVRQEFELRLTAEQYQALSKKVEGRIIEKTRYLVALEGGHQATTLEAEVDIFKGELEGLIILEVEFDSLEESEAFVPPGWFGKEITADRRFANSSLSRADLCEIRSWFSASVKDLS